MAKTEGQHATMRDISGAAAALMRGQAHSMDSQGRFLIEMAEKLRREADRVEHGGEVPDLRVVEEADVDGWLPEIAAARGGGYERVLAADGQVNDEELAKFLDQFHARWKSSPMFAAAFNNVAAGAQPSFDLARVVIDEITTLELMA
jgi:hypothetical protein